MAAPTNPGLSRRSHALLVLVACILTAMPLPAFGQGTDGQFPSPISSGTIDRFCTKGQMTEAQSDACFAVFEVYLAEWKTLRDGEVASFLLSRQPRPASDDVEAITREVSRRTALLSRMTVLDDSLLASLEKAVTAPQADVLRAEGLAWARRRDRAILGGKGGLLHAQRTAESVDLCQLVDKCKFSEESLGLIAPILDQWATQVAGPLAKAAREWLKKPLWRAEALCAAAATANTAPEPDNMADGAADIDSDSEPDALVIEDPQVVLGGFPTAIEFDEAEPMAFEMANDFELDLEQFHLTSFGNPGPASVESEEYRAASAGLRELNLAAAKRIKEALPPLDGAKFWGRFLASAYSLGESASVVSAVKRATTRAGDDAALLQRVEDIRVAWDAARTAKSLQFIAMGDTRNGTPSAAGETGLPDSMQKRFELQNEMDEDNEEAITALDAIAPSSPTVAASNEGGTFTFFSSSRAPITPIKREELLDLLRSVGADESLLSIAQVVHDDFRFNVDPLIPTAGGDQEVPEEAAQAWAHLLISKEADLFAAIASAAPEQIAPAVKSLSNLRMRQQILKAPKGLTFGGPLSADPAAATWVAARSGLLKGEDLQAAKVVLAQFDAAGSSLYIAHMDKSFAVNQQLGELDREMLQGFGMPKADDAKADPSADAASRKRHIQEMMAKGSAALNARRTATDDLNRSTEGVRTLLRETMTQLESALTPRGWQAVHNEWALMAYPLLVRDPRRLVAQFDEVYAMGGLSNDQLASIAILQDDYGTRYQAIVDEIVLAQELSDAARDSVAPRGRGATSELVKKHQFERNELTDATWRRLRRLLGPSLSTKLTPPPPVADPAAPSGFQMISVGG